MKKRVLAAAYVVAMVCCATMFAPQVSMAESSASFDVPCDKPDEKNKFLSRNCKPKTGYVCETDCEGDGGEIEQVLN